MKMAAGGVHEANGGEN